MKNPSIYTTEINEDHPDKYSATLYWEDVEGSVNYGIQVKNSNFEGDDNDGWTTIIDTLTGTIIKKKNLVVGESYFFRVRAKVGEEWQSQWSESTKVTAPSPNPLVESILKGSDKLLRGDGAGYKEVSPLTTSGKIIFLYFSAHWCPPCRQYTPMLISFYKRMKDLGKPLEVIFVSLDKDLNKFKGYFKTMPWLAADYNSGITQDIAMRFQVSGVPSLKVISPTGKVIESDGVRYPLNEQTLEMFIRMSAR